MRCWLYPLAAVASAPGPVAQAHHSIARFYDGTEQVTIEGIVAEFRFINPHPFLIVDVDVEGRKESWQLEMDNRVELAGIGVTAGTFRRGDRVVARGSPGRLDPQTLYLRRLERHADGLLYEQRGGTPSIAVGPAG